MKSFYLVAVLLLGAVATHAQRQEIPTQQSVNNITQNNYYHPTSAADDSLFGSVKILPNLAVGRITIVITDANPNVVQQGECVIFNSSGLAVAKSPFITGTNQVYVTTLAAGMYYVKLIQKNGQEETRGFLVMR